MKDDSEGEVTEEELCVSEKEEEWMYDKSSSDVIVISAANRLLCCLCLLGCFSSRSCSFSFKRKFRFSLSTMAGTFASTSNKC